MGDKPVGARRASGPRAKNKQGDQGGCMSSRRQKIAMIVAGTAVLLFLFCILVWQRLGSAERWNTFLAGDPRIGAQVFQQKGCSGCLSLGGAGPKLAPDLVLKGAAGPSMNGLVPKMGTH